MERHPANDQGEPGALVIAGGTLAVVSSFLTWFEIEVGTLSNLDNDYKGTDLMETVGIGVIGLGSILVILGVFQIARGGRDGGRGAAVAVVVVSAFIALSAAAGLARPATALGSLGGSEVAEDYGVPDGADIAEELRSAEDEGVLRVKSGIGVLLALGAAVISTLGAAIGLTRAKRKLSDRHPEPSAETRGNANLSD